MKVKLYVGNLSHTTTEADLKTLFAKAGQVASVALVKDRDTGNSKGFAFVAMSTQVEVKKAINMFNGLNLDDRELKLEHLRWSTEKEQLVKQHQEAMAKHDRAQTRILRAKIDQAAAQIALLEEQLERCRIVAGELRTFIRLMLEGSEAAMPDARAGDVGAMPPFAHLSDGEMATIVTYVRRTFGRATAPEVTVAQVAAQRSSGAR